MNTPLPEKMEPSDWVKTLKEYFIPDDLNDEACLSLIHYFEDLGLLCTIDREVLVWSGLSKELGWDAQKTIIQDSILKMSQTEEGLELSFFIGFKKVDLPTLESLIGSEKSNDRQKITTQPELASDLSNLQIVKKVGKQLKPFLDVENKIVSKLQGKHTTKIDARHLFQYIFGKINSKAQPRKWEQLSRKRHR